jgi:outer membrane lipase/esterase
MLGGFAMPDPLEGADRRFSSLVVFGDSLSDNGNAGRFTNGRVWVEHLGDRFGLALLPVRGGGSNYAVGGARCGEGPNSLADQVRVYLAEAGSPVGKGALHIVFCGGNDLLGASMNGAEASARAAGMALGQAVHELATRGAREILLPNLPDVGHTPAVRAYGSGVVAVARRLTIAFNDALEATLNRGPAGGDVRLCRLNLFVLLDQVMADPAGSGFDNVTFPCAGRSCDRSLFWDDVHPTAHAHRKLALAALAALLGTDAPGSIE